MRSMSTRKQRLKSNNKWKTLFYSLLVVNIAGIILLIALIFWPVSRENVIPMDPQNEQESSEFIVRTTKDNLNELINAYINQLQKDSPHHYQIALEDDVHLMGELPVFSSTVPLAAHLEPIVQENGDISLQLRSISVGLLELPNKIIMEYMDEYLPMPDWVTINPRDEEIYIAVTEMDIKSNFKVAVEHIDLEANNLAFKLKIPYETLGIEKGEAH